MAWAGDAHARACLPDLETHKPTPSLQRTAPFQVLTGITSQGKVAEAEAVNTGVGFATSFPVSPQITAVSDSIRACGPSTDASSTRDPGCTPDLPQGSPYGAAGSPGFGPAQWAYTGGSLGPPVVPTGEDVLGECSYSLTVEQDTTRGLECRLAPAKGGTPWPAQYADGVAIARFATGGWRLPAGTAIDQLPEVFRVQCVGGAALCNTHACLTSSNVARYATTPLRWGFEQGTLAPYWGLKSPGNLPQLAVTKACFLSAHSGTYQLCSAYPWARRNSTHGLLHVQSAPFVLGPGELTWQMNGGDDTTPKIPPGTLDMAINGLGSLGVSLSRASDGYRVLSQRARSGRFWATQRWSAEQLASHVGEKMTLDVFDYRSGPWAWLAVDTFVIPAAWVQINTVSPSGGPTDKDTQLTVAGANFGSTTDGLTVFVGPNVCTSLRMVAVNTLTCTVSPDPGCAPNTTAYRTGNCSGITISVVIGDRSRAVANGPFGGYQAGHCGQESAVYPFSACRAVDAVPLPLAVGTPKRGFTFRAPPQFTPSSLPCTNSTFRTAASLLSNGTVTCLVIAKQDVAYQYSPASTQPDGLDITYAAGPLPTFLSFDAGDPNRGVAPALAGTPLVTDATCPFGSSCPNGVPYTITLYATDTLATVNITFTLLVVAPTSAAVASVAQSVEIPAAPSPAWTFANADEWAALRTTALSAGSVSRAADALVARSGPGGPGSRGTATAGATFLSLQVDSDDGTFVPSINGRDPVESAFLAALAAAAAQPRVNATSAAVLLGAASLGNGPGIASSTRTYAYALQLALRSQTAADEAAREEAYVSSVDTAATWLLALNAAVDALIQPLLATQPGAWSSVGMAPSQGVGPPVQPVAVTSYDSAGALRTSTAMYTASSWPSTGVPVPVATPPGSVVTSIVIPTLCTPSNGAPFNFSLSQGPLTVPCADLPSLGMAAAHTLWVSYPQDTSLKPLDMGLQPADDVPHADLLAAALASSDVATCVWALADRIAAYAARWRDLSALDPRFNATWSKVGSTVSVTLATPLPAPAPPLVATLDIDHGFPFPAASGTPPAGVALPYTSGTWQPKPPVKLLRLDGIPWHGDAAVQAIGAMLDVLPPSTPLAARLLTLEAAAATFAKRCADDCSGRGICNWAGAYPPACDCVEGATGSTCAASRCPSDCNGRGPCDSEEVCTYDAESGQTTCVGGSAACACLAPWGGASCDSQDCPSVYLLIDKQYPANLSKTAIKALYTSHGWAIDAVWQSGYDGVPWALGAVAGDKYSQAAADGSTAIAVVRFFRSEQAALARAQLEAAKPSIPSRGVVLQAASFLTQYRALAERQRYILNYFQLQTAPCSAAGSCNSATGLCNCTGANAAGPACELRTCPAGCGGHGACNTATGVCMCDSLYLPDTTAGCALQPLGMASTTCEDAAVDGRLSSDGTRLSPVSLSCLLGVPAGMTTAAGYCPPSLQPGSSTSPAVCYTTAVAAGSSLCVDCSGYALANVSFLHIASDAAQYAPNTAVPGIGALPNSSITFQLDTLRSLGIPFTAFVARPGIVRRWAECDCTAANSYCGASFSVVLDGVTAWSATVADGTGVRVDVRYVKKLTLVTTSSPAPTSWRFSGTNYSGGVAPGVATAPQRAAFCDGAAWAGASLI